MKHLIIIMVLTTISLVNAHEMKSPVHRVAAKKDNNRLCFRLPDETSCLHAGCLWDHENRRCY